MEELSKFRLRPGVSVSFVSPLRHFQVLHITSKASSDSLVHAHVSFKIFEKVNLLPVLADPALCVMHLDFC